MNGVMVKSEVTQHFQFSYDHLQFSSRPQATTLLGIAKGLVFNIHIQNCFRGMLGRFNYVNAFCFMQTNTQTHA